MSLRFLLSGVAILLILPGCSSTQTTVAQPPKGTAPTNAQNPVAQPARGTAPTIPTSAPPAAAPSLNGMPEAPVWKHGTEWTYRHGGPGGSGTSVWSVAREEAVDGVPHYVLKSGAHETFYRKSDRAFSRETVDGVVVIKDTPSRLLYKWPMSVRQTWEQTLSEERPKDRLKSERVDTVTVEGEETVTVPAGTFKTFKIVCRNKKTGTIRYEMWYSPEVGQWVKLRENLDSGLRVGELVAFKLR
jgi:hypothetical protein